MILRFVQAIGRGFSASILALLWCFIVLLGVVILWVIQIACVLLSKKRPLDAFLDVMDDILHAFQEPFQR